MKYLQQIEAKTTVIYDIRLNSDHDPALVTDDKIQNVVNSLNRDKATDVYGVTAEHVYYGGQELLNFVNILLNNTVLARNVPPALKLGILNPIFRKKEISKNHSTTEE